MTEAVARYTDAIVVAKACVPLRLRRAQAAVAANDYVTVQADTAMVLRRNGTHVGALHVLGVAQFNLLGQLGSALQNLRMCMRVDPRGTSGCAETMRLVSNVAAHRQRAAAHIAAKEWDGAVRELQLQLANHRDRTAVLAQEALTLLCTACVEASSNNTAEIAVQVCGEAIQNLDDNGDLVGQRAHELCVTAIARQFALSPLELKCQPSRGDNTVP
jgi:hypothetical protein